MDAVSNAVIAPEEARAYVLVAENITPKEEAYNKHLNSVKRKESKKIPKRAYPATSEPSDEE